MVVEMTLDVGVLKLSDYIKNEFPQSDFDFVPETATVSVYEFRRKSASGGVGVGVQTLIIGIDDEKKRLEIFNDSFMTYRKQILSAIEKFTHDMSFVINPMLDPTVHIHVINRSFSTEDKRVV
jgi:hypothetical protein